MAANYTTKERVKRDLHMTSTADDTLIDDAIAAASREIDGYTGTEFGVTGDPTPRVFDGSGGGLIPVDRFTDPTGLLVKVGARGDYATTIAAADYVLQPHNAAARGLAYDAVVVPVQPSYWGDGYPSVQITARWGWHTVPAPVEQACRLRAIHLYHRAEAPHGVATYGDDGFGGSRVTLQADPDVVALLAPFTDPGIA